MESWDLRSLGSVVPDWASASGNLLTLDSSAPTDFLICADISYVRSDTHPAVSSIEAHQPQPTRFVARQPIFDRRLRVIGYELLFRDGIQNSFGASDLDAACRSTLDSSWLMGLDILCSGALTFVNCTREALLGGYSTLLPPRSTVVEVLESVLPLIPRFLRSAEI
jgi:hypothetical protein